MSACPEQAGFRNDQPQGYLVRRLRPEDAIGVAVCFRETYGDSYPLADCFDPQRIIEQNRTGKHLAAVAVADQTGEVVGHCSIQCRFPWAVGECGQVVVMRAHQGRSLVMRMGRFLEQEAIGVGLRCLVTYEVTSHQTTQLITRQAKFHPCGLLLGAMPATLEYRTMTGVVSQRESCMISMKYLVPPKPSRIHIPVQHQNMVGRIFAGLEKNVAFLSSSPPTGPGETVVRESRAWETADVLVRRIGENTPREIPAHLRALLARDTAKVIYLEIPLDQGGVDIVCREAEEAGFFFAGLGPSSTSEGEALIFQYLNTVLDFSRPLVATPMGREILAYVRQEQERVQARHHPDYSAHGH